MDELETVIIESSQRNTINKIREIKRDLLLLRRVVWPMREVVSTLQREPHECVSDTTRVYMRDLYDHVVQIIETIFIPLTFLAGVYGMNFRRFPELDMPWAYPAFWGVCIVLAGAMLWMFRRRGWL